MTTLLTRCNRNEDRPSLEKQHCAWLAPSESNLSELSQSMEEPITNNTFTVWSDRLENRLALDNDERTIDWDESRKEKLVPLLFPNTAVLNQAQHKPTLAEVFTSYETGPGR